MNELYKYLITQIVLVTSTRALQITKLQL